jgi:hypothetical protein
MFSLYKSLEFNKTRFFPKIFENVLCLDPEPEPELAKSRNRNHNFLKVGTGTVKNSYGAGAA